MPVVIEHQLALYREDDDGVRSSAWHVKPVEVDGVSFVEVTNKDKGFVKFLTGKTAHVPMPALELLKQAHTRASLGLAGDEGDSLFETTAAEQKALRAKCVLMRRLGTLPLVVDVGFPAIGSTAGIRAKCLTSIDAPTRLIVEATPMVVDYLVAVCSLGEADCQKKGWSSREHGVHWRVGKECWQAQRFSAGSKRYKLFHPADPSDEASVMEEAARAGQWVRGELEGDDVGEQVDSGERP